VGLDGVEFVMALEETFHIAISDDDAQRMQTPRDVVDYIVGRLGPSERHACLEQRAFYRLRRASMQAFGAKRNAIKPDTRWDTILPGRQTRHNWHLLQRATGTPWWPHLTVRGRIPKEVSTVGSTARRLAINIPGALKDPGIGWNRQDVERIVVELMRDKLGITTFRWNQHFVKDLGVD
jgi:Phosphopantetheine attachment site